jgi:hypothetical protein
MASETPSAPSQPVPEEGKTPAFFPWQAFPPSPLTPLFQQAADYWIDACQRWVLTLDTLRERGNIHNQYVEQSAPNVLLFDYEVIIDGRELLAPVNYMLMRMIPPKGFTTDPTKRPFIVFDPRAGHGPGIGGMKKDSEIGIALTSGHPCYFVSFLPSPVPGQTIEDISKAEALFVAKIVERHPLAERPCLIGNCQAGWQIALMSAMHPDLPGVLILAGAPMSYWNGTRGGSPMRYTAGIVGGTWLNALVSDMGNGIFDGAWLIVNFEHGNPANTYWTKNYNLYKKVDTEAKRFLGFEKWWGSPVLLNGEEIQYIVDELFVGNHFATGKIKTNDGFRIDLKNIKSPIVCFCSHGDEITPPQQALGWITDLYKMDDEIVANGQTIIYAIHPTIGHLGIFVSNSVAMKEHEKLIHNMDLIETLPPGLYEAMINDKDAQTVNPDMASGKYVIRFERRTLDDLRKVGVHTEEEDRRFAAVARISENLEGLYNTFASPWVKMMVTEQSAELLRQFHPTRFRFAFFSDRNPLFASLPKIAETVRQNRRMTTPDNLFWQVQEKVSKQIVNFWDAYQKLRDMAVENFFMTYYGSPVVQAAIGLRTVRPYAKEWAGRDLEREREIEKRLRDLTHKMREGGIAEALIRALIYVAHANEAMDEREYAMIRRLRSERDILPSMTLSKFKDMIRQQYLLLLLDTETALDSIPYLLDRANGLEKKAVEAIRRVIEASGVPTEDQLERLARVEPLFKPANAHHRRRATDPKPVASQEAETSTPSLA